MFSPETLQKFAREVTKYPAIQKQSAVMACLAHAQEEKGWLTPDAIESVANYLDMPPMAAFEVASLYNMYDLNRSVNSRSRFVPIFLVLFRGGIMQVNISRKNSGLVTVRPPLTASSL